MRRSLDARSNFHDGELYLLESVNFAANVRGMADAVETRDVEEARELLRSVLALKRKVKLVAIVGQDRRTVVESLRAGSDSGLHSRATRAWGRESFVKQALNARSGKKTASFSRARGRGFLTIAAPICSRSRHCVPVGAAIVGMDLPSLAEGASGKSLRGAVRPALAVYGSSGRLLAAAGEESLWPKRQATERNDFVRRSETRGKHDVHTLYAPLEIRGRSVGTLAVSLPSGLAFSSVRESALRLAALFFLAIAGVVGIGMLLSRYLLAQMRPLIETSRELGRGNLGARVPIVGRDELGELAGVLNGMASELQSSHETLERRVDERTEQVRKLLEERTEFFAGISHELRTPIAIILSEARMLVDPQYSGNRGSPTEAAETITASAEQLLARVNDILELARAQSGRLEMHIVDLDLPLLLSEVAPTIETLTGANDLSFAIETHTNLPLLSADRSRLKDVIVNLVENAVKYTPPGGQVTLTASAVGGKVAISVSDTGVGIPEGLGDKIFEPFFQVAGTRPQRGEASMGLGLAVAKRLVEAQAGTITYRSVAEGTTFTVELPAAKLAVAAPESNGHKLDKPLAGTAGIRD